MKEQTFLVADQYPRYENAIFGIFVAEKTTRLVFQCSPYAFRMLLTSPSALTETRGRAVLTIATCKAILQLNFDIEGYIIQWDAFVDTNTVNEN